MNESETEQLNQEALDPGGDYPRWVKNPNPNFTASIGFAVLFLGLLFALTFLTINILAIFSSSADEITNNSYIVKNVAKIIGILFTFIASALAIRPRRTPWWMFLIMLILSFVPVLSYVLFYFTGKFFAMMFTKPATNNS